jgi:hypothetical protein
MNLLVWERTFKEFVLGKFSKACQYRTIEEKVCKNLKYVSIKFAQVSICKSASLGPRNFGKKTRME